MVQHVQKNAARYIELAALIVAMVLVQMFQPPRPCHCVRHARQRQEAGQVAPEEPADPPTAARPSESSGKPGGG